MSADVLLYYRIILRFETIVLEAERFAFNYSSIFCRVTYVEKFKKIIRPKKFASFIKCVKYQN